MHSKSALTSIACFAASPKGEKLCAHKTNHGHENHHPLSQERKPTPCPLHLEPTGCFAKGQTDTPINRHNRGEVSYDASVG